MNDHSNEVGQQMKPLEDGTTEQPQKMPGLPKPPLFTADYIAMAEILEFALDRFGRLVLALMYYTADGTMPEDLPPDLKMMFGIYQRKVDAAREKYDKKCLTNAENGAKGGRPKKNAKVATEPDEEVPTSPPKKADPPIIKFPPTKNQLIKLIEQRQTDGFIAPKCNPVEFFEWMEQLQWRINKEPAQNVEDILRYAEATYPTMKIMTCFRCGEQKDLLPNVYGRIFKEFHGMRDEDSNTKALQAAVEFLVSYEEIISDKDADWIKALNEFMRERKTEQTQTVFQ